MVSSPSGLLTFFVRFSARNRNSPVLIFRYLAALLVLTALCLPAAHGAGQTIVVVGDSLSSGYGIAAEQSWVAMLEDRLQSGRLRISSSECQHRGRHVGGRSRALAALARCARSAARRHRARRQRRAARPTRRDAARQSREDDRAQPRAAVPTSCWPAFRCRRTTGRPIRKRSPPCIPSSPRASTRRSIEFLLEDVALNRELMQPDGIHPNAAGQKIVFANVWRVLGPLLKPRDAG